jgi:protein-disulfide isomerase
MPRSSRFALAILVTALAAPALASPAAELPPRALLEGMMRDYLLREPEILEQAIQVLEKKREAQAAVKQKEAIAQRGDQIFRDADDPVGGNAQGDVTLVEFFDYGCGYCRSVAPAVRTLLERDKGVRLVFKEMPVFGKDSVTAAKLALAAHKLDPTKYPALHFALMGLDERDRESLLALAARHGFDRDRLSATMDGAEVQAVIDANMELGHALGIQGTPSFLIGGEVVPGVADAAHLATLIAEQRKAQKLRADSAPVAHPG